MLRPLQRRKYSGFRGSGSSTRSEQSRIVFDRIKPSTANSCDAESNLPAPTWGSSTAGHGHRTSYVPHPSFGASGAAGRYREFEPDQIPESEPDDSFSPDQRDEVLSTGSHRESLLQEAFLHLNYRRWIQSELDSDTTIPLTAIVRDRLETLEREVAEIRNWIMEQNEALVTIIASRFLQPGVTLEELRSEANTILLRTIDRFDVQKGVLFSTYASAGINRHLRRWLGGQSRSKFQQGSLQELEIEPISPQTPSATRDLAREATIRDALQSLPRVLQQIVKLKFGLGSRAKPLSFRATAERLGISRERCRRLCMKALERLKSHADVRHFEPSS